MKTKEEKRKYAKEYYQKNIHKIRKQHLEYQKRNRQKLNKWAREYRRTPEGFYKHVEKMAKRRKIEFSLTKRWFVNWLKNQKNECLYCRRVLEGKRNVGSSASIDRIDSRKGYEKTNIVLSCELCNRVKNKYFTKEEMMELGEVIKKIMKIKYDNN